MKDPNKTRLQDALDILLSMSSKGEVCPLSSQQISVIIDILRHQEQRITELEQTIKTWKISFYAGGFAIVTVFYVFDWFLTNSASIREVLQNFLNKEV